MGGIWSASPPPIRPGAYINFETIGTSAVAGGNNGIVGLPITADWGPTNEFVELLSDAQYLDSYGPNNAYKSYLVQEAFRGGALRVLAYRMDDGTANFAILDLVDDNVVTGNYVAVETLQGSVGFDEIQTLTASGLPTGGTFTLGFTGTVGSPIPVETTAPIAYNASAAAIQAALEALPSISVGDVTVTGGPAHTTPVVITFDGNTTIAYNEADIGLLVVTSTLVTESRPIVNLVAKYTGERANAFKVVVRDNPLAPTGRKDVLVYEGATLKEKYSYAITDHAELVAKINDTNRGSRLLTATLDPAHPEFGGVYTAELLNDSVGSPLTGGLSGENVVVADYTDPLGVLDSFKRQGGFDVFTLPDEVDTGLIGSVVDWAQDLNDTGQYVEVVIGGDDDELLDTAASRSEAINLEWIVNVGRTDLNVTYPDGNTVARRTAAMTARVAGKVAGHGVTSAITFSDMSTEESPVVIRNPLTKDEVEEAIQSGVVVFAKRGARVLIEDDVTTFVPAPGQVDKDATFSNIKSVRTMQQIGRDFNEMIENGFIGATNNDSATRAALLAGIGGYLSNLEDTGVLQKGSTVLLDDRYDSFSGDTIYLLLLVQFGRELKRVLMTLRAPVQS
jgi:hypothetical protein